MSGMTTAPTGHPNQAAYDVTDDGMNVDGSDVAENASDPNDKIVSLLLSLMIMIVVMLIPIVVTLVGIVTDVSDEHS